MCEDIPASIGERIDSPSQHPSVAILVDRSPNPSLEIGNVNVSESSTHIHIRVPYGLEQRKVDMIVGESQFGVTRNTNQV